MPRRRERHPQEKIQIYEILDETYTDRPLKQRLKGTVLLSNEITLDQARKLAREHARTNRFARPVLLRYKEHRWGIFRDEVYENFLVKSHRKLAGIGLRFP